VQSVYDSGYFVGTGGGSFSPEGEMTRAMFITVLGRLARIDASLYTQASFSDVNFDDWFAAYAEWGYSNGIIKGVGGGNFGAGLPVTREQIAVMAYNYAALADYEGSGGAGLDFADSGEASPWALDALGWLVENGVIQGKPGNLLDPGGAATRAEVAAIVVRLETLLTRE
jgi:hypothetical protein